MTGGAGDRWERVAGIVDRALQLSPAEREAFLAAESAGNDELRAEVDQLLAFETRAERFMDDRAAIEPPGEVAAPARIGRYRILERIGSGGMGIVYLAERADETFEQRVAIKVLRAHALGHDLARRMRRERQVLADLDHPGVARLIDGGETDAGDPYLVMEHVDGVSIDRYCGEHGLDVEARLRLFVQAAEPVQFAHQSLVIHRDLKPSNILVDSRGQPRVIDFGIALPLYLADAATMHTRATDILGTLAYMSPEQCRRGAGAALDVRSDVYALGVVLYQLLTGRRPHDVTQLTLVEAIDCITNDPVPPPSSHRRELSGDLETIMLTAVEKDPDRRYASVAAMIDDIGRFLRHEPILARPPGAAYATRKFIRRHPIGVGLAAVASIALVATTVVAVAFAIRASQEQAIAESINAFFNEGVLSAGSPDRSNHPDLTVREALDRASTTIGERFADTPRVEASIRHTIGGAYRALGLPKQAIPQLEEAVALHRRTRGDLDDRTRQAMRDLVAALFWDEQMDRARAVALELVELDVAAAGALSAEAMATRYYLVQTGGVVAGADDLDEPIDVTQRELHSILEWDAANLGDAHPQTLLVLHAIANNYLFSGQPGKAEPIIDRIWVATHETYGPSHPETLWAMLGRGVLFGRTGREVEAVAILQEAVRLYHETKPDDYHNLGITLAHLGENLERLGRHDEAEAAFLEGYDVLCRGLGPEIGWTRTMGRKLMRLYEKIGDEAAAQHWREQSAATGEAGVIE